MGKLKLTSLWIVRGKQGVDDEGAKLFNISTYNAEMSKVIVLIFGGVGSQVDVRPESRSKYDLGPVW